MGHFGINEMLDMQRKLQDKYKDKWEGISPEVGLMDQDVEKAITILTRRIN